MWHGMIGDKTVVVSISAAKRRNVKIARVDKSSLSVHMLQVVTSEVVLVARQVLYPEPVVVQHAHLVLVLRCVVVALVRDSEVAPDDIQALLMDRGLHAVRRVQV